MDIKDAFLGDEETQASMDLTLERFNMDSGDPISELPYMLEAYHDMNAEQVLKFMAWFESNLNHNAANLYLLWREARMELTNRLQKVKTCEHQWVDARSHIVASGEVCGLCYAYKP